MYLTYSIIWPRMYFVAGLLGILYTNKDNIPNKLQSTEHRLSPIRNFFSPEILNI